MCECVCLCAYDDVAHQPAVGRLDRFDCHHCLLSRDFFLDVAAVKHTTSVSLSCLPILIQHQHHLHQHQHFSGHQPSRHHCCRVETVVVQQAHTAFVFSGDTFIWLPSVDNFTHWHTSDGMVDTVTVTVSMQSCTVRCFLFCGKSAFIYFQCILFHHLPPSETVGLPKTV